MEAFWALNDVSFEIRKGDSLGLIGLNGSGKSTMLKTIAGVLKPTKGSVFVGGTMAPLIELGAGFDMDLTERENVFLNGALLGYTRKQMEGYYEDIVEFSELQNFMDVPVKNFSSGMVSRLAFAIATIGSPDILIVDEVLSVGDFLFQEKCEKRIQKMIDRGTTILFVSHSIEQVEKICNKVAVMEFGKVVETGSVIQVFSDPQSDIAKRFVGNLIHDVIPEPLVESIRRETRNSRLLRIKLENTDSTEPLLWDINRRFEVETNILYSTINVIQGIVVGIMLVLFIGSDEEIKKAERYILESNEEYKEVVLP